MDEAEITPLKNFDNKLQKFYYDVISKEVDLKIMWKAHSIRRALTEVVKAYKKRPRRKSDIRFDTPYRRCAYLLKHSPCFTSAVAKYFHTLVSGRQDLIKNAFENGTLAICCLGGGPATDAVALVHIIRYLYEPYWRKYRKTLKISITVVDISEEWQETARNVLECLQTTPEFFGDGELTLTYDFLTADLTKEMSKDLKAAIKSADIVTMIYFLSAVTGTRGRETSENMVERIMLQMKKGACVFFLDSAVDKHYEILNKASEKRNVMQQIYGPLVEEFHTISIESVQHFIDLYSKHFFRLICMTHMFFCVSAWLKPKIKEKRKYIIRELLDAPPPLWKKPTEKESADLTEKMKMFRSTVFRLLNKRFNSSNKVNSCNGCKRDIPRQCGKNEYQKYSRNTSDFARSTNFRNADLWKSDPSNNIDRNFRKTVSANDIDFERPRNFGKNKLAKLQ
ncbi:uncharacterized protein [Parasteatoda tepidariorum]|uniref:uncharacterized protein n=1 Tax=Parasteatoda tepidariorum TaxID=114398 RepID=UPI0039BD517C